MPSTAGIDLLHGRPTPAVGSTEARLQQRKRDALRRGVHRIKDAETPPYGVHVIGNDGSRFSASAVDIGSDSAALANVQSLASKFAADSAQIETLARCRGFLELEYPMAARQQRRRSMAQAWGEANGATGKMPMLADAEGTFTAAFGLVGRSQRYSMVVDDGVITRLDVEKTVLDHDASSASCMLRS